MMTRQIITDGIWDSTPIGRSIDLCLRREEIFSPQLILEDKVLRSTIRLRNDIQFLGTLISDDESQRLTYVIDRLLPTDSMTNDMNNHQALTGEFLIPIRSDQRNSTVRKNWIQDGIKEIEEYCYSSLPVELHRFSYLEGRIYAHHSSSIDLSFDLLTIKNSFTLTPIDLDYIQMIPTALLKDLSFSTGNNIYNNRPHFGYCSLDRMSKNQILLITENDPQACALPLVGIWISGIIDIQCAFVWAVCLRYCLNSSLKQRFRSGMNPQQSFLLACYSSTLCGQCIFYEAYSASLQTIEYDLWTSSQQISVPNLSSYQYETDSSTQCPYDFQFQRVHDEPHQVTLASPNTNGSLFGFPRIPPKQSTQQSPSWDLPAPMFLTTPRRTPQPSPTTPTDNRWKEEFLERMKSYETQIHSLTALVTQLITTQQSTLSTSSQASAKRHMGVQSEPSSPCINDQALSMIKPNQHGSRSAKREHYQPQTSVLRTFDRVNSSKPITPSMAHQEETIIDYSSLRRPPSIPADVNPVDILKPIFQFIDHQQQKQQQQQRSASSLMTTSNSTDTTLLKTNGEETGDMFHSANVLQQQQHMTSTTTTGISLISNGLQMQFINQKSSITTVYPQSQSFPPPPPLPPAPSAIPTELLPTSPPRSENNLSIEVHGLEMKYLEDDQLAAAIECDQQSQTPQVVNKSLSFGTQEYLQRYGLFTDSNSSS